MRQLTTCLVLIALVAVGAPAFAAMNTIDQVPAATLLLPYFEVDLDPDGDGINCNDGGDGVTTLFSINNASQAPQLAHVNVFTDLSRLGLDFDVYLTGYDVQTINLRDIFCNGDLPATAIDSLDGADTISPSPTGTGLSTGDPGDGDFLGGVGPCASPYLAGPNPFADLGQTFVQDHLQTFYTGQFSSILNGCGGALYGDSVVRGYLTVDNVQQCTLEPPNAAAYFEDAGAGIATNNNTLWGDYFYVDAANNFAQGETLVHIEAFDSVQSGTWAPGDYTFYARYVGGTAEDNREPLGTQYATRFIRSASGLFNGGTDIVAWRDAKFSTVGAFTCAGNNVDGNLPFPLSVQDVVAFDEQENPEDACFVTGGNVSPAQDEEIVCFPLETQRVNLDGSNVPGGDTPQITSTFGWLFLNMNTSVGGFDDAGQDPTAQAWITPVMSAEGRFSVGFNAIQLDSAADTQGTTGTTLLP